MSWPIHPVAELFPFHAEGEDWEAFVLDVQLHGIREPIVIWQGRVIDGRRRLRAVELLRARGLTVAMPEPVEWDEAGSLIAWVYSRNLHLRHLTAAERADRVVAFADLVEEECRKRGIPNIYGELAVCEKCGKAYASASDEVVRTCTEPAKRKKGAKGPPPLCGGAILHPTKTPGKRRVSAKNQAKAAGVSVRTIRSARKRRRDAKRLAELPEEEQAKAMRTQTARARRRVEASELERALGDGGKWLEKARKDLGRAAKALAGYDARASLRAIEKAQDKLAEDSVRLLEQAKGRAA